MEQSAKKVFISGSMSVKTLPEAAKTRINNIIKHEMEILVGDCYGVDSCVQEYLESVKYKKVTVCHIGHFPRNNYGFSSLEIDATGLTGRFAQTQKDIAMGSDADFGLVIWDGKSKGSERNILQMKDKGKYVAVITVK